MRMKQPMRSYLLSMDFAKQLELVQQFNGGFSVSVTLLLHRFEERVGLLINFKKRVFLRDG